MDDLSPIQIARFWSRVRPASDFQCWEWTGAKVPSGYGRYSGQMAHRIAYSLLVGPIQDGLIIRHKCDNPPCCNPRHLVTGTNADNAQDMVERDRHTRGQRSARSKLTPEQVEDILTNRDGLRQAALARKHGVSKATVSMIRSGQRWSHLATSQEVPPPSM